MRALKIIWLIILFISVKAYAQPASKPPYDLEKPDMVYRLPDYLEEVSGLTYYKPYQLAMHNDEKGRMYIFDLQKRTVVQKVRFAGDGDFEGIERVDDFIYIVKSNGKLYRFHVGIEGVVEEIETPFSSKNNVEGLGYDKSTHQLLIALKDDGDIENVKVSGKSIYGYDINKGEFPKLPIYAATHQEMKRVLGEDYKFHPSAVAVHPLTSELFVLSADKRSLMIFGVDKKPKSLTELKRSLFPQPEGIAFAPNGDMFIANEEEDEGGTLLWFKMK